MITELDKNSALVLIDFQKGIVKKETAHPVGDVIKNAALLVDAFRRSNRPIIATNVDPIGAAWTKSRKEVEMVFQNPIGQTLEKGEMKLTGFTEFIPETDVKPEEDILITKKTWNAFFETPLQDELVIRNITQLVLCGISTSIGVEGTARAASELGYNIAFAVDAMTDTVLEAHNNSILNIFPRLGELGPTGDIIKLLNLEM